MPGAKLRAVVCGHLPQAPAGGLELPGDAVDELARVARAGVVVRGMELGPGKARGHIGGGVLPDGSLRALEAPDEKAVELDLLAGLRGVDVAL